MNYLIRELVERADGKWHWRLKARNGEIICHGQAHPNKTAAKTACETTLNSIHDALSSNKPMMALKLKTVNRK